MLLLGYALIALSAALIAIAAIIITFILVYVSPLSKQRKTMSLKALTIVKMVPSTCLPENLKKSTIRHYNQSKASSVQRQINKFSKKYLII